MSDGAFADGVVCETLDLKTHEYALIWLLCACTSAAGQKGA